MASEDQKNKVLVCRICLLGTRDTYSSLFDPFKDFSAAYYINTLTNVHIQKEDTLPDRICTTCLLDLDIAIGFKLKCESSDAYLKKTLDEINAETNLPKLDCNEMNVKEEKDDDPDYEEDYLEDDINEEQDDFSPVNNNLNKQKKYELPDSYTKIDIDLLGKCPITDCGKVFKSEKKLKVHLKMDHNQGYYCCYLCKAKFFSLNALEKHKMLYSAKCKTLSTLIIDGLGKDRIFTCPTCNYSTSNSKTILQHLVIHTGEKKFSCIYCNKGFSQRSSFELHKENVHKMYKKVLTCDVCGIKLFGQRNFTRHMRKHSSKYFECDLCHKRLKSKSTLIDHLRRHEGLKAHSCEYCAKQFVTLSELFNHRKVVHLNQSSKKILNCQLCAYKAGCKKSMSAHMLRHGSGNMPCETCGMFFETELKYWLHKICHYPQDCIERRTCPICNSVYDQYPMLNRHISKAHLKKKKVKYDTDQVISRIKLDRTNLKDSNHKQGKKHLKKQSQTDVA